MTPYLTQIMKRNVLIIACLFIATLSFGETNGKLLVKKPVYGLLSNGFYVNLGVAFPTFGILNANSSNFGFEPNLEIGNQWYFTRNEYWGFGLKLSWIQAGFSSYSVGSVTPSTNVDLRFLKLAPQFTYLANANMAIDITFEVSPTLMLGGNGNTNPSYSYTMYGVLFAPGLRFRYKQYAVGGDFGFGSLTYTLDMPGNAISPYSANIVAPRFYLGLQF